MDEAAAGLDAHERGAAAERRRIAQDMHDDVGARLLMLIHRAATPEQADLARAAMNDLRAALSALEASPMALADALADWRAEAAQRCEAAGVELQWRGPRVEAGPGAGSLPARQRLLLERALRESLSNALKHARPREVTVAVDADESSLALTLTDDGEAAAPADWVQGRGLRGMRQRVRDIGGSLEIDRDELDRTRVRVRLPMAAAGEGG
jgi:signal transduction histidine kinase